MTDDGAKKEAAVRIDGERALLRDMRAQAAGSVHTISGLYGNAVVCRFDGAGQLPGAAEALGQLIAEIDARLLRLDEQLARLTAR